MTGTVPAVLALTLNGAANLGPFIPGVAADYQATLGAVVTSTAASARLTVADPSSVAPGRLVNGTFALATRTAGPGDQRGAAEHGLRAGDGQRQPADAADIPGGDRGRRRHGHDQAIDRGHRAAAQRGVQQDADVHAVGDAAVTRAATAAVVATADGPGCLTADSSRVLSHLGAKVVDLCFRRR